MKVLHINTWSKGGAWIACRRLHEGLLQRNVDSKILVRECEEGFSTLVSRVARRPHIKEYYDRVKNRLLLSLCEIKKNYSNMEIFSSSSLGFEVELNSLVLESDIIHLHWVADFLNFKRFFKLKKKIVWTIHDLNPFMGGLHYTIDEARISYKLRRYEMKLRRKKHKYIQGKGIHFVFLSEWTYKEACKLAPWLRNESIHFIYNGINTTEFFFKDIASTRISMGLPLDKKILLFVSENIDNYRKGFDILTEVLTDDFIDSHNIYPVAIGCMQGNIQSKINFIGPINDPSLMSKYYSVSDMFILPSRQDNLPNVMLESLVSGCPIVAFKTGGMNECLDHSRGVLCDNISADSLRDGILRLLNYSIDRSKLSELASIEFDQSLIAEEYKKLYQSIL